VFLNDNQLTELDVSTLSNLNTLNVENNRLTILNIKNGNTNNIANLNVDTNPDLFCILVDDADFAEANFSTENPFTLFTETGCYTAIPDANFEAALNSYDDIPNDGQVPTGLIARVPVLSVQNAAIQDLTGIEAFTELMILTVDNNPIQQLDLTNNTFLQNVEAQNCNLQTLNVAGLPNLMRLQLTNNALTSLDFTTVTLLNEIDLSNNNLESLNLKNGNSGAIAQLDVRSNPNLYCVLIDDINLLNNPNILFDSQTGFTTDTYCRYTAIPDANFESALNALGYDDTPNDGQVPTALIEEVTNLDVSNASITDLTGIADFEALVDLRITGNAINTIDLSNNTQLQVLIAMHCSIQNLNLFGLTNLYQLTLQFNSLTSLDLSTNPALRTMNISLNNLSYVNLQNGNNGIITDLDVRLNPNLECVLIDDLNIFTTASIYFDNQTNFTTTQFCGYTAIPDTYFEAALQILGYDDITGDGQVPTDLIENLTELDVRGTNISDLTGIEDFVSLTELDVSNNNLTTISLTTLTNLGILDAQSNIALTSLDLSGNTQLEQLVVEDCTSLTTLDLSTNVILEDLIANQTSLSSITFGNLTNLSNIDFDGANFISLDLSSLTALTRLDVSGNQLISLNIANGNNSNFISFDARNNTNLRCIAVDDPAFATANFTNIDAQTSFRQTSCYTAIPDANFEAALTALDYDDIPNDGQVPTYAIENVVSLDVRNLNISSIVGIEDFTALETLNVNDNNITSLDISNNINLKFLRAVDNGFASLDVTNNPLLEDIRVEQNALSSIDLSNQPNLRILQIDRNNLNAIDLSTNTQLTRCRIFYNNLTTLDLSNNPLLGEVTVYFNNLETLDLRSGGNTNINSFRADNNPNLTCISVDDAAYSTTNWTGTDAQTSFSETEYCRYTAIPDAFFENALNFYGYDDISGDGQVPTALIETVVTLEMINNGIADLTGIEDFTALEELNIAGNSIDILDLSSNINLIKVNCEANGIDTVNLTGLTALEEFIGRFNGYITLDVSTNTSLITLYCNNTDLTILDVSNLPVLTDLNCSGNFLTSLNVRNGNNTNFTNFNATNNPNLVCIFVDDAAFAETNFTNVDATANFTSTNYCGYTSIPDVNFEAALEYLGYDDISADGQVPTELIENVTILSVENMNITDLTGIEDFTALEELNADLNALTTLDLSANTALENLSANDNNLTSIDLSALTNLTLLQLSRNNLSTIDFTSNTALEGIVINEIPNLTSLDLTNLSVLRYADSENSPNLTTVTFGNNPSLATIDFEGSGLTAIDVSNLPALRVLDVRETAITTLDVSNNPALDGLTADDTALTSLDLSNNPALESLRVENAALNYLNVRNGTNTLIYRFRITNNPNLTCVLVDDTAYSTTNWTDIDAQTSFTSTDYCEYTAIPDANFEAALGGLGYDDIFADGQVPTALIENVTNLDMRNSNISSLTGIEDFTALQSLNISNNSVNQVDFSNNTQLISFRADFNGFTTIDLSNNPLLEDLRIARNQMTSIDLSNQPNLINLQIDNNNLTAIDLSVNTLLSRCRISANNLTSVDLFNNPLLTEIRIQNCNLSYLNVQSGGNTNVTDFRVNGNANLTCILVDDVAYSTANWTTIDAQSNFVETSYCDYTAIPDANFEAALDALGYDDISADGQVPTELIETVTTLLVENANISDLTGIQDFIMLEVLNVRNNNLTTIDLSQNTALISINAVNNNLTALDVTNSPFIDDIRAEENAIVSIDLSNQPDLIILQLNNNQLTALDISNNPLISRLRAHDNFITSLDLSNNTSLREVQLNGNQLEYLNIQNGANTNITDFRTFGNPNLTCIVVDDAAYSTTNWTAIDATTSFSDTYCRYTAVPDANFEAALEALGYDDISADGQVPTALIENITSLDIQGQSIADITGIEDFTALGTLRCTSNSLTTIDLSSLTNLTFLWCDQNQLTTLDLSNNTAIRFVNASQNTISTFNGTGLNLLEVLSLWSNQLASLDLSDMTALIELDMFGNLLTSIDVSNNTALQEINVRGNNITALDFSNNTALMEVDVRNNDLMSLNIKNGNNTNITSFAATSNPNLTCILVDDALYSTTNWTTIDPQTSFSNIACANEFTVDIKVYLQGAALNPNSGEETLMRDDLRAAGLIPTTSPYGDGNTCEATVFNVTGNDAIVDWIWVELRDASDNTVISDARSALLQRDGDIVTTDGISSLDFLTVDNRYYVAIKHRNHLGIMTANAATFNAGTTTTINFKNFNTAVIFGNNSQTDFGMPTGVYGMWCGNANGDAVIQYSGTSPDTPSILSEVLNDAGNFLNFPTYSITGYNTNDSNMDGTIQYSGTNPDTPFILQNVLAHLGNFLNFSTYQIIEQLPENVNTTNE
jgi:Leucine-rich repeat (LRR) protein